MDINVSNVTLEEDTVEVVLGAKLTVSLDEKTACTIDIKQAGIFTLKGFDEKGHEYMLGSYCPNLLFPYLREEISNNVNRAGFPQLLIVPINFDALYQEQQKQKNKAASQKASEAEEVIH